MKKIVVEIDGVRHRLVKETDFELCENCSLEKECSNAICDSFKLDGYYHFEKEEEVCG
jgi:hypothetical protein